MDDQRDYEEEAANRAECDQGEEGPADERVELVLAVNGQHKGTVEDAYGDAGDTWGWSCSCGNTGPDPFVLSNLAAVEALRRHQIAAVLEALDKATAAATADRRPRSVGGRTS